MDPLLQRMDNLIRLVSITINQQNGNRQQNQQQKKKKQKKMVPLEFIELGHHRLACSHAPSPELMDLWHREQGVTDIVTLLRSDEPKCSAIKDKCASLNIHWHHLPISGARKLCESVPENGFQSMEMTEDLRSLLAVRNLSELLRKDTTKRTVVIHCAAGMHRTGLTSYLMLRDMGYSQSDTLKMIQGARPVTHKELLKEKRPKTWFQNDDIKTLVDFAESFIKFWDLKDSATKPIIFS